MTEIVPYIIEDVQYRDAIFTLIHPEELFDFKKHGLSIKENPDRRTSAGLNLYSCRYEIKNNQLYLKDFSTDNIFTYRGWKKLLKKSTPMINNVKPNINISDPRPEELIYQDIDLKISYTGELEIGKPNPDTHSEDSWDEIVTLKFKNGNLILTE